MSLRVGGAHALALGALGALALAAAAVPGAHAQNITFSTGQSEYYFAPGERPAIPLDLRNDHGRDIAGMMSFTVAQDSGQGNVQTRTINAGSQRFEARAGNNTVMIDLGAVAPPARLEVELSFTYNDGFDPWTVEIGPIVAHVVDDPADARNEPNPVSAQAQAGAGGQQAQQAQQAQQQQQGGQGQQGGGQQAQQQQQQGGGQQAQQAQQQQQGGQAPPADPLGRLQNNQMAQDSAALRQQIQEQLREEAGRQNRFAEALSADPSFAEQHRRMIEDGYEVAGGSIEPSPGSEEDGEFEIQYQSPERGAASIRGAVEGGQVTEMEVMSEYSEQRMLEALRGDPRFAEMSAELEAAGYEQTGAQFSSDGASREAVLEYEARGGGAPEPGGGAAEGEGEGAGQARIRAEFNGTDVTAVSIEYGEEGGGEFDPAHAVLAAAVAGGAAAAAYTALRGQGAAPAAPPAAPGPRRRADPSSEARRLMGEARILHAAGDEKGAFASAGRAVRIIAADRLGIGREVTNAEIAAALGARRAEASADGGGGGAGACLEVASLVEFARMRPGGGDFGRLSAAFDLLAEGGEADEGGAPAPSS